jgi:hypothetical protein
LLWFIVRTRIRGPYSLAVNGSAPDNIWPSGHPLTLTLSSVFCAVINTVFCVQ